MVDMQLNLGPALGATTSAVVAVLLQCFIAQSQPLLALIKVRCSGGWNSGHLISSPKYRWGFSGGIKYGMSPYLTAHILKPPNNTAFRRGFRLVPFSFDSSR